MTVSLVMTVEGKCKSSFSKLLENISIYLSLKRLHLSDMMPYKMRLERNSGATLRLRHEAIRDSEDRRDKKKTKLTITIFENYFIVLEEQF